MERKEGFTLSKTQKQKIAWIDRLPPVGYARKLYDLDVTVAEALEVMAGVMEMGYDYQELVVREMIILQTWMLSEKKIRGYTREAREGGLNRWR